MSSPPIGFLIKLLDDLIEADLNRTLDPFGLDRRRWQILNLLTAASLTRADIAIELAPFLTGPEGAVGLVEELVGAGLVERSGESLELSPAGHELLGRAGREVSIARSRVSEGLSREDYQTTVGSLETMCRNLGWSG